MLVFFCVVASFTNKLVSHTGQVAAIVSGGSEEYEIEPTPSFASYAAQHFASRNKRATEFNPNKSETTADIANDSWLGACLSSCRLCVIVLFVHVRYKISICAHKELFCAFIRSAESIAFNFVLLHCVMFFA